MLRVRVASSGWIGGPGLNTFYFLPVTEDANSALDAVTAVRAGLSVGAGAFPTTHLFQVSGDVDQINETTGAITNTFSVAAPAVLAGGAGGVGWLPLASAIVLRFTTGAFIAGRRLRGRAFLSPIAKTFVDADGTPTGPSIAFALALGNSLLGNGGSAGGIVIWHRPVAGAGGQAASVTTCSVQDKFGVLTSRRD